MNSHQLEVKNSHQLEVKIDRIEKFISENQFAKKEILSLEEAAGYMRVSQSYLYKLTSKNEIPFHKPMNKLIYFRRIDLDAWMLRNRRQSRHEIENEAFSNNKRRN